MGKRKALAIKVIAGLQLLAVGLTAALVVQRNRAPDRVAQSVLSTGAQPAATSFAASAQAPGSSLPPVDPLGRADAGVSSASAAAQLPARLFDCNLGRIANFDPNRDQPTSEYVYSSRHAFKFFLPSIAARTTPPPEATDPAEPVDPRTRILSDPDGIAREALGRPFNRVVDLWPTRVEMTTQIDPLTVNVIVIDRVDLKRSTALVFMTKANDAVTFDLKHLYFGPCRFSTGGAATAALG